MKLQEIEKLAQDKNYKTETHWTDGKCFIGISMREYVWHWFYVFNQATSEVMFDHTYYTTTGATKKSNDHQWKIYERLENLILKNSKQ